MENNIFSEKHYHVNEGKKEKQVIFIRISHILYTGCLKIREFRIQSVVGDHFSSPNMEIKKNRDSPHKDTLV
jgi:hypothetical protein